jgi:hypothetical protein
LNSFPKEEGLIHDPVFGCPYYFQADFKGKLFWARNREHLLEMENYVSSDLRTRLPYRMRMVERLPTFIKEAKNREAILKILQKMEKLIQITSGRGPLECQWVVAKVLKVFLEEAKNNK